MPLFIRRGVSIHLRASEVAAAVGYLQGELLTRARYRNLVEGILTSAHGEFHLYLYAKALRKPSKAAWHLDRLQGILEYELALALMVPIKGFKDKRKVVQEALTTVCAETDCLRGASKRCYQQYSHKRQRDSKVGKADRDVLKSFRNTPGLGRLIWPQRKQVTEEFSSWISAVLDEVLLLQESRGSPQPGKRGGATVKPK